MKEITNKIVHYFKDNLQQIYLPSNNLSNESESFFRELIKHLKAADSLFKNTNVTHNHYNKVLENGKEYFYIPKEIRNEIENMDTQTDLFIFNVLERSYRIILLHEKLSKSECLLRMHRIFLWLYLANIYSNNPSCSQHVDIYFYFTPFKKILPSSRKAIIDRINANTAYTSSCSKNTQIYIFREEEWYKVLIHESFHNMGFDFSHMDTENIDSHFRTIFPLNLDFRIFEAYTETWAETIHSLILAYLYKKDENIDIIMRTFDTILWNERKFSMFQCGKVLHFNGISYTDLYEKSVEAEHARKHKYKENTYIFSYYILKAIIIYYINDFIEWCKKNNTKVLSFKENNVNSFIQFIQNFHNKREIIVQIKQLEEWFDKNTHSNEVMRTMRMTMFEL